MLCACSGEQFQFEDAPQSPESLATRDFSASGLSSTRTTGRESKYDDAQVGDVESTLIESLTLNYEEARALLGRLEYQGGKFDAALQVFQGIDIRGLKPLMTKAIIERTRHKKPRHKPGEVLHYTVISMHSANLLLEAILLKSLCLNQLTRHREAAVECGYILDIFEAAWGDGVPESIAEGSKLQEIFHRALELLPKLWKQAGFLEDCIVSYRRALGKPWNLDCQKIAMLEKELAVILLYGGLQSTEAPSHLQKILHFGKSMTYMEESILLFLILLRKVVSKEIAWDSDIIEHLGFALSMSDQYSFLGTQIEHLLPGSYNKVERWYLLALCYSAAGQDDVSLNLLRKVFVRSENNNHTSYLLPSLVYAAKLCSRNQNHAHEGIKLAERALECAKSHKDKHLMGMVYHLVGICYQNCSRDSMCDSQRLAFKKRSLIALHNANVYESYDHELVLSLAIVNAMQRNLKSAIEYTIKYSDMVAGTSVKGLELLALVLSAERKYTEAESIVDLALGETAGTSDQMELLRLKGMLQNFQEQPKCSIETYKNLLAVMQLHTAKHQDSESFSMKVGKIRSIELDAWLDLAKIYMNLSLPGDSEICLDKAKFLGYFSPRTWYTSGKLFEAQASHDNALAAFSLSLSIDPDYVPSMVTSAEILIKLGGLSVLPIARSFLMNALRLEPMNHEAWMNLGLVCKSHGMLIQAADCFQAACELSQSNFVRDITLFDR